MYSCGEKNSSSIPLSARQQSIASLSPHRVQIGGISFYQSYDEVKKRVRNLSCSTNYLGDTICYWKTTNGDSNRGFENIDQIIFTFVRDTLHEMKIDFLPMFDVEFSNFQAGIKQVFGSPTNIGSSDSSQIEWHSDSLNIILVPNKRLHWTKFGLYVYAGCRLPGTLTQKALIHFALDCSPLGLTHDKRS